MYFICQRKSNYGAVKLKKESYFERTDEHFTQLSTHTHTHSATAKSVVTATYSNLYGIERVTFHTLVEPLCTSIVQFREVSFVFTAFTVECALKFASTQLP